MKSLTMHHVTESDKQISVTAVGDRTKGNTYPIYLIEYPNHPTTRTDFQTGLPSEGINGLTNEILLSIVADRLRDFQAGPYPCDENEMALSNVLNAMNFLQSRTRSRIMRGVEGKLVK